MEKYEIATMAKASLRDASISFKSSIEVAKRVRGMMSDKAEKYLEAVKEKRLAVPFTRFTDGAGHRKGKMAAGKYPVNVASSFLALVKQGVANAESKGLGTPLKIARLLANEGSRPVRAGTKRGRMMKRTSLELVMIETSESKRVEKKKKGKSQEKKVEASDEKSVKSEKPTVHPTPKAAEATPATKPEEKKEVSKKTSAQPVTKKATETKPVEKVTSSKPSVKKHGN